MKKPWLKSCLLSLSILFMSANILPYSFNSLVSASYDPDDPCDPCYFYKSIEPYDTSFNEEDKDFKIIFNIMPSKEELTNNEGKSTPIEEEASPGGKDSTHEEKPVHGEEEPVHNNEEKPAHGEEESTHDETELPLGYYFSQWEKLVQENSLC